MLMVTARSQYYPPGETVPLNALPDFFGRAYGAVMAAAQQQGVEAGFRPNPKA